MRVRGVPLVGPSPAIRGRSIRRRGSEEGLRAGVPAAVAACALAAVLVAGPSVHRYLFAAVLTANLVVLAVRSPRLGIYATFAYLPLLGLIRRLLIADAGWTAYDPLLLVGPIVAAFLAAKVIVVEQRPVFSDALSKLVGLLVLLSVVQVANPHGGGVAVGLGGLIFLTVPLLWFFVGRELATRRLVGALMATTVVMALAAAAYGVAQTSIGFPSWDRDWLAIGGYSALHVGDLIRAFGPFSSASEYLLFLGVGTVISVAFIRRWPGVALALPVLVVALFLGSGRSAFALTALAVTVMLALRLFRGRAALLAVLVAVGLYVGAFVVAGPYLQQTAQTSGNALVVHQAQGLGDPLNPQGSTLITHLDAFEHGVTHGLTHPVGQGTGSTSIAADKLGGPSAPALTAVNNDGVIQHIRGTDIDVSNVFVSLGLVGGVLYLLTIVGVGRRVVAAYARDRDPAVLAVIGILVVCLGQWLQGGHYAVAPLLWLLAGWATRPVTAAAAVPAVEGAPVRLRPPPPRPALPERPPPPPLDDGADASARPRFLPTPDAEPFVGGTDEPEAARAAATAADEGDQDAAVTMATSVLMLGANFLTGIILARTLGADGRGATAALLNSAQVIAWLFALGSVQTISYFQAREPERGDRLLGTWLVLTLPLGLAAIGVGEALIPVLFDAQSAATIQLGQVFIVTTVLVMLNWTLVGFVLGDHRFVLYNAVRLASPTLNAVLYGALAVAGVLNVATAVWSVAAVQVAVAGLLLVLAIRRHGVGRPDRELARSTMWYGLRAHGASVSGYLNARLDLLIMPAFLSATSVGLYSVATNVSWIVFVVPGSVAAILLPVAARKHDEGTAAATVLRSMWSTLAVAAGLALVMAVVAGVAVRLVYGGEFAGSVLALRVLLPGSVLYAAAFCLISGLYGAERPFTAAVVQAIGLALSGAALLVFLRSNGIVAAAVISTAAYALVFVLAAAAYRRVAGLRWRDFRPPADLLPRRRRR